MRVRPERVLKMRGPGNDIGDQATLRVFGMVSQRLRQVFVTCQDVQQWRTEDAAPSLTDLAVR